MKRPKNAASNTAFTMVAESRPGHPGITRVSLDPGSLDSRREGTGPRFRGRVVWDLSGFDDPDFLISCRAVDYLDITAVQKATLETPEDLGRYLEHGFIDPSE